MHLKALNAVGLYRTRNFQILLENRNWMEKLTCELALHLWPWSRVALGPVARCGRILHTALVLLLKARPGAAGATAGKDLQHLLPRQSLLPHEQFEGFSNLSQTLGGQAVPFAFLSDVHSVCSLIFYLFGLYFCCVMEYLTGIWVLQLGAPASF